MARKGLRRANMGFLILRERALHTDEESVQQEGR